MLAYLVLCAVFNVCSFLGLISNVFVEDTRAYFVRMGDCIRSIPCNCFSPINKSVFMASLEILFPLGLL